MALETVGQINQSIIQSINQSVNQPFYQPNKQPIDQLISDANQLLEPARFWNGINVATRKEESSTSATTPWVLLVEQFVHHVHKCVTYFLPCSSRVRNSTSRTLSNHG